MRVENFLETFWVRNFGPRFIAAVWLNTPPGAFCRQLIVKCPPEWVERVELKVMGLPLVEVDSYLDEEGVRHTAGQRLATLNGLAGLHLTGGDFSILFTQHEGGGAVFKPENAPYLFLHLNDKAKADHPVVVALVCRRVLGDES